MINVVKYNEMETVCRTSDCCEMSTGVQTPDAGSQLHVALCVL